MSQEYGKSREENQSGLLRDANVLITGATGLIGSVLAEYLLEISRERQIKITLVLLVRNPAGLSGKLLREAEKGNVKVISGDVRCLPEIEGEIDYIVHGAGITESRKMVEKPVEVIRTNLDGTVGMLELARKKKVKGMVYLSSMEVYGFTEREELLTEDKVQYLNPLELRSSYPESKRMSENLCVAYADEYHVPVKIIRLAQTFGYGVKPEDTRVFAEFARCARDSRNIRLMTDGKSRRMYLDTKDASSAILTVLLKGAAGEAYNAANKDTYCSIREMAEIVASEIAGGRIRVEIDRQEGGGKKYPPTHRLMLDVSKLEALGWKPETGLRQMYVEMLREWENTDRNENPVKVKT